MTQACEALVAVATLYRMNSRDIDALFMEIGNG